LKFKLIHDQHPHMQASKKKSNNTGPISRCQRSVVFFQDGNSFTKTFSSPVPRLYCRSCSPSCKQPESESHLVEMNSRLSLVMTRKVGTVRFRLRRRAIASLKADCESKLPAERYESNSYVECSTKNHCVLSFLFRWGLIPYL
jgi:hypothetical protein